jgi:cellulose synthase/poly-beta-1,6-N-acetylglucosamine synthase-like glycosyltransferase
VRGVLFLAALAALWLVLLYGVLLALAGYRYRQRRVRRPPEGGPPKRRVSRWPGVSVLVPAHNEERVIQRSLEAFLGLDYPRDRLEVVVVNDASTDGTGRICNRMARADPRLRVVRIDPRHGPRGKAGALNKGLAHCRQPVIAVYDADNRPRPESLRALVAEIAGTGHRRARHAHRYVAAVGRIVKVNRRATLLNRFASIEFAAFQWAIQAGQSQLFNLVLLPGTNYVIEAGAVRGLGGWDPRALTEDLELSVRVYASGGRVAFVPEAISEEQDPERLRPWLQQRLRWVLGNYYVVFKHAGTVLRSRNGQMMLELLSLVFLYVFFLGALIVSDVLFVGGLAGAIDLRLTGPYPALWLMAFLLFVVTLLLTQALEGEDDWKTPVLAGVMYVSYTQLWLYVILRSLLRLTFSRGRLTWETTPRYRD